MTGYPELIETIVDLVDRLARHVEAVRRGDTTARDDLANVLQLLVGTGRGYGRLYDAAEMLGADPPVVPTWPEQRLPAEIDGLSVATAIRSVARGGDAISRPLPAFLDEECLRFAVPGIDPEANWSRRDLVKKVRNTFGSHSDVKPPQWLSELRYYPAADTDAISFLMWSVGEAVLAASAVWLDSHDISVVMHIPASHYLDGVDLLAAYVLIDDVGNLDVRANLACEKWASGRRRAIVGGMLRNAPFIFGLEADARMTLQVGDEGTSLRDLERQFRSTASPMGPNRRERRAAAARQRRDRRNL